jgi:RHS repeat-associated protein
MNRTSVRRAALSCALLASTAMASPALAQLSPYPLYRNLDENGVDLVRGDFILTLKEGSIGSGDAELALIRTNGSASAHQWDKYTFDRTVSGTNVTIRIGMPGGFYEQFTGTASGTNYTATKANGASLTGSDSTYNYTSAGGTKIRFVDLSGSWEIGQASNFCSSLTRLSSCVLAADRITQPNGGRVTLAWDVFNPTVSFYDSRIASVSSNYGYSITFGYQTNSWVSPGGTWHVRTGADFRNTIASPNVQASVAYAYPSSGVVDLTDMAGNVWRITDTSIQRPGETSPYFNITQSGGIASSATTDGIVTTYNRSVSGSTVTMTKTNPLGQSTVVTSDLNTGQPASIRDGLLRTTSFSYDTSGRLTRITQPEGNYVEYTLDARGNATQTKRVAKAGSGLPFIATSAVYPANCTNVLTCNQPTSTTDARGNVTDYTYDPTHGGILTVTRPAPTTGAVRPQTRVTYSLLGSLSPQYYLPTGVSECQTLASCAGGADEVKTTLGYDANANATSVSKGNGTGSLTATTGMAYDAMGNLLTVDGPLLTVTDITRFRYDAARRQVGAIGPDPDAGGSLKHRAVRTTYDTAGRATRQERGTVNSQSDPDWAAFAPLETVDMGYTNGRVTSHKLSAGGTAYALTQQSYDAAGRPECSAIRMNPALYGSLPGACSLATPSGSYGPDRITQTVYDAAGEVIQNQVAVGTADAATERTLTYTNNGQLATLKDAENNLTTYEYDGHDRLSKTRMPVPGKGLNASSTTDYEQLSYDASGNVTNRHLRDTQDIGITYDNLDRPTFKNLPGSEPDVTYVYDNLSRLISASQTGSALSFNYDALSRNLTQSGPQGTVSSEYDLAGRRTRLTYPGSGLYVDSDYLVTGEPLRLRENGATTGIGVLATFAYDDLGRRTALTRGNGAVTGYGYDPVSRLASLTENFGATVNQSASFSYNPASQIGAVTRTNDAYAWTGHASGTTTGVANGLNQLTSIGGAATAHDANGNVTTDPTSGKTYTYSSENLLTGSTGGTAASLAYDPLLRLYQVTGASTVRFAYDGLDIIAEYDAAGALQSRYLFGPGVDEPLVRYDAGATRTWYSADERGSITALGNDSGTVTAINRYDEYGKPQSTNSSRFQYTGQAWLPELAAYYYKARIYSPTLGRFLQTDPPGYGADANLYAYVRNDPINSADPSGLCPAGEYRIVDLKYRRLAQSDPSDPSDPSDSSMGGAIVTGPPCKEFDLSSTKTITPVGRSSKPSRPKKSQIRLTCDGVPGFAAFQDAAMSAIADNPRNNIIPTWLRGIFIHVDFTRLVTDIPGALVNVSYKDGRVAGWLDFGSSRPDAVFGLVNKPNFIVELKTSNARLIDPQLSNYFKNLPPNTLICEIFEMGS